MTEEEFQERLKLARLIESMEEEEEQQDAHAQRWANFLGTGRITKLSAHEQRWANFWKRKEEEDRLNSVPVLGVISVERHMGDSLYKMKTALGVSEQKLMAANPGRSLYKAFSVPVVVNLPAIVYLVQANETLVDIAEKFNQNVEEITRYNDFVAEEDYLLREGDELWILDKEGREHEEAEVTGEDKETMLAKTSIQDDFEDEQTMVDANLETTLAPEAMQQFLKPKNDECSFPRAEGNIETGITLALDADGDQVKKELILHFKREGVNVVMTATHKPTNASARIVVNMGSVAKAKAFKIVQVTTTDGIREIKILASKGTKRHDRITVLPPIYDHSYGIEFKHIDLNPSYPFVNGRDNEETDTKNASLKIKKEDLINLERNNTIELIGGPTKSSVFWSMRFKVGQADQATLDIEYDKKLKDLVGIVTYYPNGSSRGIRIINPVIKLSENKGIDDIDVQLFTFTPQSVSFRMFDAKTKKPLRKDGMPDFYVAHWVREYTSKDKSELEKEGKEAGTNPQEYARVGLRVYMDRTESGQGALLKRKAGLMPTKKLSDKEKDIKRKDDTYNERRTGHDAIDLLNKMQVAKVDSIDEETMATEMRYRMLLLGLAKRGVISEDTLYEWFLLKHTIQKFLTLDKPSPGETAIAMAVSTGFAQLFHKEAEPAKKEMKYFGSTTATKGFYKYENPYSGETFISPDSGAVKNMEDSSEEGTQFFGMKAYTPALIDTLPSFIKAGNKTALGERMPRIEEMYMKWVTDKATKSKSKEVEQTLGQIKNQKLLKKSLQKLKEDEAHISTPQRIKAVFYPQNEYQGTKPGEALTGYPLNIYYYYDYNNKGRWYIKHLIKLTDKSDHVEWISAPAPKKEDLNNPPKELFKKLNDKDNLPVGWLYYQMPNNNKGDKVFVDGHWEAKDWVKAIGIGAMLVGMAATGIGGAVIGIEASLVGGGIGSTIVSAGTVLTVGGGLTVSVAGGMELYDIAQEERGNETSYTSAILDVANGVLGAISAILPYAAFIDTAAGEMVYIAVQGAEGWGNTAGLLLTTVGGFNAIKGLLKNRENMKTKDFVLQLAWEILYLAAQDYIMIRTIQGNFANARDIPKVGVTKRVKDKGLMLKEGKAKHGDNTIKKQENPGDNTIKKQENPSDNTIKKQEKPGDDTIKKQEKPGDNIPQVQQTTQQAAQEISQLQKDIARYKESMKQSKQVLANLEKNLADNEQAIGAARQKIKQADVMITKAQKKIEDAHLTYQQSSESLLQMRALRREAWLAQRNANFTIEEMDGLSLITKGNRLGVSSSKLLDIYHKVKGKINWNQKPHNLGSGDHQAIYGLFRSGERAILYAKQRNTVYRVKEKGGDYYITYKNDREVKLGRKHRVYQANLLLTHTRYNYPVTVQPTGGVYYKGKNADTYIPIERRNHLKTQLNTRTIKK